VILYEPSARGGGGSLCTASLLGKNAALTAAHCIHPNGRGMDQGDTALVKFGGGAPQGYQPIQPLDSKSSIKSGAPDDCGHEVVYTKVSAYRDWITKKKKELQSPHPTNEYSQRFRRVSAAHTQTKDLIYARIRPTELQKFQTRPL
jgi:secreted trypsin-like serine protease